MGAKKKKTLICWSLKPPHHLLLFSAACLQLQGAETAPCLPNPVRLSIPPLAAASSKAMSCHALLPLELRPAKAGSLCDHCRAGDSCPVTNRAGSTEIRSNPTRKGGGGERERKQSKTKRKKESRFNNRVIALFRITICQRFTKLYDTR